MQGRGHLMIKGAFSALTLGFSLIGGIAIAGGVEKSAQKSPVFSQTKPHAQTLNGPGVTKTKSLSLEGVTDNSLADGAVLLQADTVTYDSKSQTVTAEGHVEMATGERVLLADSLTYYEAQDKVIARGNVSILEATGEVFFAEEAELTDQMSEGVISTFEALLQENARMAADSVQRREGGMVNELSRGVYTACDVCDEAGNTKPPLWRIKAFRVTQDKKKLRITYRDVYFEVLGMPVLYLPYFSHADPSVKRKSGFLTPSFGDSDRLGAFIETPYYFALSPHYDFTFSPLLTTEDGTVLKGDWRHRTRIGDYTLRGSFTNAKDRDDNNNRTGERKFRGHLFGEGRFRYNSTWTYGFDLELVNDDTYLRRYDLSNEVDLESRAFALGIDGRNYTQISSYYFQGLRENDDPGQTPYILPLVEGHYVFEPGNGNWGRINVDANALILQRSEGVDSRRVSVGADWERTFTTRQGQRITPFAEVRADVYNTNDLNPNKLPNLPDNNSTQARVLPTMGVNWSWPLISADTNKHFVVEPIVQLIASSNGGNPNEIPNEDSQSFEFDTTNLFIPNKFPGLDLWDDGLRANVGVKLGAYWDQGTSASVTFGRSFRSSDSSPYDPQTGLDTAESDYVGSITLDLGSRLTITNRFRLDEDSLNYRRNEISAIGRWGRFNGRAFYLSTDQQNGPAQFKSREELNLGGTVRLFKHWRLNANTRRDLKSDLTLATNFGLTYEDECTILSLAFQRRFFRDRDIEPSDSILFNYILKTLN